MKNSVIEKVKTCQDDLYEFASIGINGYFPFFPTPILQLEVNWDKIKAKIELEIAKERERAAATPAVRTSVTIQR